MQSFPQIKSPFPIDVWRNALRNHPDSALVNIEYGVRIGFHNEKLNILSKSRYNVDLILVVYYISAGQTSLLQVQ